MRISLRAIAAVAAAGAITGCTNGQTTGVIVHPVNASKFAVLQFAVGTANIHGTTGLNTVVTFRQSTGASAALVDSPTITGPAGFTIPAAAGALGANNDAGGGSINSNSQTASSSTTTFGIAGGAFEYGFAPANTGNTGSANYPEASQFAGSGMTAIQLDSSSTIISGPGAGSLTTEGAFMASAGFEYTYPEPLYATPANTLPYLVGPPAVPDFHSANYPSGYAGEPSGFTAFAAPPVAGTYSLSVVLPDTSGTAATYTAAGTLTTTTPLPTFAPPVFADDAAADGGATVTFVLPAGVTYAIVYAVDVSPGGAITIYSYLATASGAWAIPATQGPGGAAPFAKGDSVFVYAAGFDYNPLATGLGTPKSLLQSPALPAQADVTLSGAYESVY